jgi:two-component system nitrate/nitrite response regulator NarL
MMSQVTIYSDRAVLALGLTQILSANHSVEIVGVHCFSPADTPLRASGWLPGVSILDGAPGATRLIPLIRESDPGAPIVIWEHSDAIEPALNALAMGVQGVLLDTSPPADVIACLETVMRGGSWLPAAIAQAAVMSRQCKLSRREGQLVALIATGLSNKEIAWRLGISVGTVKVYLCRLFEKLGVSDRYELALLALRQTAWEGPVASAEPPRSVFVPRRPNDWRDAVSAR